MQTLHCSSSLHREAPRPVAPPTGTCIARNSRSFIPEAWRPYGATGGRIMAAQSFGGGHRMSDDRWVYPEPDRNDQTGKILAVVRGAARAANMSDELFRAKFLELSVLLPNMSSQRLLQLDRTLLAQLVVDTSGVARRLVGLQELFPGADIAKLVSKRPGLLLQSVFEHVPAARDELAQLFPQTDIDAMVQEQPLLLTEDVASCIEELQRLMPMQDPLQTLRYNPHM